MVRIVDYESRRRAILAATINKYIEEAQPIASEDIAKDFDLSPATIRNVFSELEEDGLLTHPYTSGGRIPTNKGYRYYVDFLLSQMELMDTDKEQIRKEYNTEIKRLDNLLEKTSEVISTITHYAGIVSFLEWQNKFLYKGISFILEQPEFRDYEKMRILIRMIEEKQRLLDIINRDFSGNIKVYIGDELGSPEMDSYSLVVSSYYMRNKSLGRLAALGPKRMEYKHTISTLEYLSNVLTGILSRI